MGKYKEILADPAKFEETIQGIFNEFDADKSGFIEPKELQTALTLFYGKLGIHEKVTEDDITKLLAQYDTNQDQKLSLEEFKTLGKTAIEALAKTEQ
mmetsp:Transcript_45610/g.52699  ORF Transcript_45610/g.52699 Transcript_45610/m.52699 type:complete len:97 (+) Transcript_45610:37-327(+)